MCVFRKHILPVAHNSFLALSLSSISCICWCHPSRLTGLSPYHLFLLYSHIYASIRSQFWNCQPTAATVLGDLQTWHTWQNTWLGTPVLLRYSTVKLIMFSCSRILTNHRYAFRIIVWQLLQYVNYCALLFNGSLWRRKVIKKGQIRSNTFPWQGNGGGWKLTVQFCKYYFMPII